MISMSLGGFVVRNQAGGAALFSAFNRVANFVTAHGAVVLAAAGNAALDLGRIQPFVELPAQGSNIIAVMASSGRLPPGDRLPGAVLFNAALPAATSALFCRNLLRLSLFSELSIGFSSPFPILAITGGVRRGNRSILTDRQSRNPSRFANVPPIIILRVRSGTSQASNIS